MNACSFLLMVATCQGTAVAGQNTMNQNDWPQWRGPRADGVADGHKVPLTWDTKRNVVWSAALPGWGNSSPVVHGNRVFVTTHVKEPAKSLLTVCLDRETGKVRYFADGLDESVAVMNIGPDGAYYNANFPVRRSISRVLLAAASAGWAWRHLRLDADTNSLVGDDQPYMRDYRAFMKGFGDLEYVRAELRAGLDDRRGVDAGGHRGCPIRPRQPLRTSARRRRPRCRRPCRCTRPRRSSCRGSW